MSALAVPCRQLADTVPLVILAEIASHDSVLTPGRYVGAEDVEEDGEPFDANMKRVSAQLAEGAKLDAEIRKNLRGLGYGQ